MVEVTRDDDRPSKDDPYERHMDYRRLPFNPNRETAFSRWAKQRDGRSTNIEVRRPQTEDEVELAEMYQYILGLHGNEAFRQQNSAGEKMLARVPPASGTIAYDAGAGDVKRIPSPPSRSPSMWADNPHVIPHLPLPRVEIHPPLDQYGRDLVEAHKVRVLLNNERADLDPADLDPAEQIVNDVIHGKQ